MSYLASLELPDTRYVVHYDADMLLYQAPGYDWIIAARELLKKHPAAIAAIPRVSPPFSHIRNVPDAPSLEEGLPFTPVEGGWRNSWFSTRCWLMDLSRLERYLPLLQGPVLVEYIFRRVLQRTFPMSPEIMLFRRVGRSGGWMLNMKSELAWLLHPNDKSTRFINMLSLIQERIQQNDIPLEQTGFMNVDLNAWEYSLSN